MATLVFDYDGTLHDSTFIYLPAFRMVERRLMLEGAVGSQAVEDAKVLSWIGLSPPQMWADFMPGWAWQQAEPYSKEIGAHMIRATKGGKARWYPGVAETLETLKNRGHRLMLLSNCTDAYMGAHRQAFPIDRYFESVHCSQNFQVPSKKEILRELFSQGVQDLVMIGDRQTDMEAGRAMGALTVGCTYGFGREGELKESQRLVDAPVEWLDIL